MGYIEKEQSGLLHLANQIHYYCLRGGARSTFVNSVTKLLHQYIGSDLTVLWLEEGRWYFRCETNKKHPEKDSFEVVQEVVAQNDMSHFRSDNQAKIDAIHRDVLKGTIPSEGENFSRGGSYWTQDILFVDLFNESRQPDDKKGLGQNTYRSLLIVPVKVGDVRVGIMRFCFSAKDGVDEGVIQDIEYLAEAIGIAFEHLRTHAALRERLKELTCLYNIAKISASELESIPEILSRIVELIPPAWHYPNITMGRIVFDNQEYHTDGFFNTSFKQLANISVLGQPRGQVEVYYKKQMPELDEGPFLIEERSLINTIANQISLIVERIEAKLEKDVLQEQLRHADRLGTIGQLAAGVAHEINEPLGNVLGFAQLAMKNKGTPQETIRDLERIEKASLHAREVIRNLLTFARQDQSEQAPLKLNDQIEQTLTFIESRLNKANIDLVLNLDPMLPMIQADPMQMSQVVINLLVNSIHAMSEGGKLTITTKRENENALMLVKDEGRGIPEEIIGKIFLPFFTTKKAAEGTGLGLAVVHSIITSHRGSISVKSEVDVGTEFAVKIPLIA